MTKAELTDRLYQNLRLDTKVESARVVNAIIEAMREGITTDGSLRLIGFGCFNAVKRAERRGRNPRNGAEITIESKVVVRFTQGKHLKERIG